MIGSVGGFDAASFAVTSGLLRPKTSSQDTLTNASGNTSVSNSAETDFLNYMKKSPAERMEDAWLKAHGLSKEKLAAMSPKDREAVMRQMENEIKDQLKRQAEAKAKVDITV